MPSPPRWRAAAVRSSASGWRRWALCADPRRTRMPMDTSLVDLAIALPVVLALAALIALVLRRAFGPARSLSMPTMTVIGVLGVSVGLLLSAWVGGAARLWVPTTILFSVGASLGLSAIVAEIGRAHV